MDHSCSGMGRLEERRVEGDQGATTKDERQKGQQGKHSSGLPHTQHSAWHVPVGVEHGKADELQIWTKWKPQEPHALQRDTRLSFVGCFAENLPL